MRLGIAVVLLCLGGIIHVITIVPGQTTTYVVSFVMNGLAATIVVFSDVTRRAKIAVVCAAVVISALTATKMLEDRGLPSSHSSGAEPPS